ncbi:MAG: Gfo/Idh/MocA family oxidoreductase [Bacteroidia bacterium]
MSENIRWGIIGCGDVCEVKSAPAMQLLPHAQLVAVMRRDTAKARDYAQRHGVPRWYDDADRLIHDPEVDAVYIATPPDSHADYTLRVAAAGKPVYVEKPMARTVDECEAMIAACRTAGVPLFVAYYRRALPHFLKIKALVDAGEIGEVRSVSIRMIKPLQPDLVAQSDTNWRVRPAVAGEGYFYDLASHQLDFLDFLLGPIVSASGVAVNQAGAYEAADQVAGHFLFANDVAGTGLWCFSADVVSQEEETLILGSKGHIRYPTFGKPAFVLQRAGEAAVSYHFDLPKHIQMPLIETIIRELRNEGKSPSNGDTAIRTNRALAALTGHYTYG